MSDAFLYLYGFVSPDTEPPPATLEGLDGRPIEILPLGRFGAVVSRVSPTEYDPDEVALKLRDLAWVGRRGADHERVVTWFVDHAFILPARFLTLYRSRATLEETAAEQADRVVSELDRLAGLQEWDLKVSFDLEQLSRKLPEVSEEAADFERAMEDVSPGRRYLMERARIEKLRSASERVARELAEELLDRLGRIAERTVRVPLPRGDDQEGVVLSGALLVRSDRRDELRFEVDGRTDELADLGVHVGFSGPWAPYRFLATTSDERHDDPR